LEPAKSLHKHVRSQLRPSNTTHQAKIYHQLYAASNITYKDSERMKLLIEILVASDEERKILRREFNSMHLEYVFGR
jgi:hypothetical protein